MVAVAPLLHEIIPHGGSRLALVPTDATITTGYSENDSGAVFREHLWRFMYDPSALMSLWVQEQPIAYAARVLRESGATPAQTKVGIHLALGKARPEIADELGLQLCAVGSLQKALSDSRCSQFHRARHENLAEPISDEARQGFRRAG
jgi:hypothetical protein